MSTQFKPGQSGNPKGRPKGSRNKLSELFWADLYAAWEKDGAKAIQRMIKDKPGEFVRVVANQMPKEHTVVRSPVDDMSIEELEALVFALTSADECS